MASESTKTELLVNGDFATGDLSGWTCTDPADYNVVKENGKNIVVMKATAEPAKHSLEQTFMSKGGCYSVTIWYRCSTLDGEPLGKQSSLSAHLSIESPDGSVLTGTPFEIEMTPGREWQKFTRGFGSGNFAPTDIAEVRLVLKHPNYPIHGRQIIVEENEMGEEVEIFIDEFGIAVKDISVRIKPPFNG